MAGEISTKLKVEGLTEFKNNINAAKQTIKGIDAELGLAEAQFKATGDSQTYLRTKAALLSSKMAAQKTVIENLQKQYDAMNGKAGVSQSQMNRLRTAITNAKTKLVQMETAAKEAGTGVETLGTQSDTTKSKLSHLATGVDFANIASGAKELAGMLERAAQQAVKVVTAVGRMAGDAADTADNLITQANATGLTTEQLQQYAYAARFVDTEVDTITKAIAKMTGGLSATGEDTKTTAAAFAKLGISTRDASGAIRPTTDLFWEAIEALGEMENTAEADTIAQDLFGKSFQDLNPLIRAGADQWEKYCQEAKDLGLVLSDDQIGTLGSLDDALERMDATMDAAKLKAMTALAPALEQVANLLTSFMNSPEGQDVLQKLAESAANLVTGIGEKLPSVLENITSIATQFSDAIANVDINSVVTGIEAFFALWTGAKVTTVIANIGKVGSSLAGLLGGGGGGAPSVTGGGGGAPTVTGGGGVLKNSLKALGGKALSGLSAGSSLLIPLAVIGGTIALDKKNQADFQKKIDDRQKRVDDAVEKGLSATDMMLVKMFNDMNAVMSEAGLGRGPEADSYIVSKVREMGYLQLGKLLGTDDAMKIWKNFNSTDENDLMDQQEMSAMADKIMEALARTVENAASSGEKVPEGMAAGIEAKQQTAIDAAQSLANSVSNTINNALDIHSPSRVMARAGQMVGAGMARGIDQAVGSVQRSAARMSIAASGGSVGTSRTYNSSTNFSVGTMQIRNDMDAQALASEIAAANRRAMRAYGA